MRVVAWVLGVAAGAFAGEAEDLIARVRAAVDRTYSAAAVPDRPPQRHLRPLREVYEEMVREDLRPLGLEAEWRSFEALGAEAVPALLSMLDMSVPSNGDVEDAAHARIERWARHVMAKPTREQRNIGIRRKQGLILIGVLIRELIDNGVYDTLGRIGAAAQAAAPELNRLFDDALRRDTVYVHLAAALLDIDAPSETVPKQVLKWIVDEELTEFQRVHVARAIIRFGPRRPQQCRMYWARVLRADDAVRTAGIDAVAGLGLDAVPFAAPLLGSRHRIASAAREAVRRIAAKHLLAPDDATIDALVPVAGDIVEQAIARLALPYPPRAGLARLLGHAKAKRSDATRALLPLLDDPQPVTRRTAAEALGRLRAKPALAKLRAMLAAADPESKAVLEAAIAAIEK